MKLFREKDFESAMKNLVELKVSYFTILFPFPINPMRFKLIFIACPVAFNNKTFFY